MVACQKTFYPGMTMRYQFLPGLLVTCKQARNEGAKMFLGVNTFQLQIQLKPASDCATPYRDDGRHLYAFLRHLERAGLPPPANLIVRIRRKYSHLSTVMYHYKYGMEIFQQLVEICRLTAKIPTTNVVCRVEALWGTSSSESADIAFPDALESARRQRLGLEERSGSIHFPRTPWGMAASFLWRVLEHMETRCINPNIRHLLLTNVGPAKELVT